MTPEIFGFVTHKTSMVPSDWRDAVDQWVALEMDPAQIEPLRDPDPLVMMSRTTVYVNSVIAYGRDGPEDHWATPEHLLTTLRGDCEDFAMFKLSVLLNLGFDPEKLWVCVVYDAIARQHHAFLLVFHDGTYWILDNRTSNVIREQDLEAITPIMTLGTNDDFLHGRPVVR